MLWCPNPPVKWKLLVLDKRSFKWADDLSKRALRERVQNERLVNWGERLTGTSNLAKLKGKGILLYPKRCTHRSKILIEEACCVTEKEEWKGEYKLFHSLIKITRECKHKYNQKETNLSGRTSLTCRRKRRISCSWNFWNSSGGRYDRGGRLVQRIDPTFRGLQPDQTFESNPKARSGLGKV